MSAQKSDPKEPTPVPGTEELMASLALVVSNTLGHQWFSKTDRDDTIDDCFRRLTEALDAVPEITFRLAGTSLSINDVVIQGASRHIDAWVRQMDALQIGNFMVQRGLSRNSFNGLIEILTARPEEIEQLGGFANALTACGVEHVTRRNVIFREITEDETVVARDALRGDPDDDAGVAVGNILAFLQGEGSGAAFGDKELEKAAPDARQLAELILRAAEVEERFADVQGGTSVNDVVLGCIRRAHTMLNQTASARTKKGRKKMVRDMMVVEQEVMKTLRALSEEAADAIEPALTETVQEIREEIRMDDLASDYARKRKALRASEEEIARYMDRKGVDELEGTVFEERLQDAGLPLRGWKPLVVGAGDDEAEGSGGEAGAGATALGGAAAVQHLAELLERMDSIVGRLTSAPQGDAEAFSEVLSEVNREVGTVVDQTTRKIKKMAEDVHADAAAAEQAEDGARRDGLGLRMSRKKLLELLAEIVQELFQPLAVINCSIEMIQSGRLGDTSDNQRRMLDLADESARKLRSLMRGLQEISGVPKGLSPDHEMLESHGRAPS